MYKIIEDQDREKYILMVPAMLDAHFPLIKYAFYSKNYRPVILDNEEGVTDVGLKYVNNDMCYPCILNVGQMIAALQSGKYDPKRVKLLMPTAGDACRGSNYLGVLRRAVWDAGFHETQVVSLNVKGIDKDCQMKVELGMVWRALFGLFYGDILMLLLHQTRPNELEKGQADACWEKWIGLLSEDLKQGKHLTIKAMRHNFRRITEDFAQIPLQEVRKQRVGIVGELYIKYCHMGNWNMIRTLEEEGCESHTNGLSWYVLYYIDSHLATIDEDFDVNFGGGRKHPFARLGVGLKKNAYRLAYRILGKILGNLQKEMVSTLQGKGFYTLPTYPILKEEAKPYVNGHDTIGDGYLIGSEMASHILHDCRKVVAVQPFGCMPNQICGRGLYPSIARKLPQGHIVSIDVDSSASKLNAYNRVKMLVDAGRIEPTAEEA